MNKDFWAFYLGYYLVKFLKLVIVLIIIFIIAKIFFGCGFAGTVKPESLPLVDNFLINELMKLPEDSLLIKVNSMNSDSKNICNTYKILFLKFRSENNSLRNIIAFKDSNTNIMLQSIEYGLEHISDEGLQNLIEIRNK